MKKAALVVGLLVVGLLIPPIAVTAQTPQPNIVVILTDDMRVDQLARMPTVQSELVAKGTTFTNMFIQDPLCCPSRVAFLRGQMAHTTGTYNVQYPNYGGWAWVRRAELENETLPVWLDRAGYFTAEVGKYVNGYNSLVKPPGWDYWRGKKGGYQDNFSLACIAPDPSCPTSSRWEVFSSKNPGYEADEVTNRAVQAIERSGTAPLFGWFAYFAPHNPYTPPARYMNETSICGDADRSLIEDPAFNERVNDPVDGSSDKPRWLKNRSAFSASTIASYRSQMLNSCRALLAVDDGVQAILAALEEKDPGLANTIVVLTSDQGSENGEHMHAAKKVPYDSTARAPFVLRAPGLTARTIDAFTSNIDLAPTLLELAGATGSPDCPADATGGYRAACLARGGGFDGESFAALLRGEPFVERQALLIEHWDPVSIAGKVPTYCSVRTKTSQLTRYFFNATKGPDWEGYDLSADPDQLHSLVYSNDASGTPRFRPGGQALFDALYPTLKTLCDPLPGGGGAEYPAFP